MVGICHIGNKLVSIGQKWGKIILKYVREKSTVENKKCSSLRVDLLLRIEDVPD
jgi:hypothetical protein